MSGGRRWRLAQLVSFGHRQSPYTRFGMSATAARTRSPLRVVLRFVASVMMVSGLLLIADAGVTLAWQEPVSAFLAQKRSRSSSRRP